MNGPGVDTTRVADQESVWINCRFGRKLNREMEIVVGKTYLIEPMNPQATKNRGRLCTVLEFIDSSGKDISADTAKVKFQDTGRTGKVDLSSLIDPPAIYQK